MAVMNKLLLWLCVIILQFFFSERNKNKLSWNFYLQENNQLPGNLAFWMANSSELLHFLKQDVDISLFLRDNHQALAQSVQMAFRHLVQCVEQELRTLMSAFLDKTEDADLADSDVESMIDSDSPDNGTGERSFRYGMSGRPLGGDSWLGEWEM